MKRSFSLFAITSNLLQYGNLENVLMYYFNSNQLYIERFYSGLDLNQDKAGSRRQYN